MIENKKYFVDQINSSKAYQFTCVYHYSGVGFKKAILNLGVFRKTDKKLVGVLQWGNSFQDAIRLDRYVKEPITKDQYFELNRFCMADEEGKNSESQAISLGIKYIKQTFPHIKLLVSYAGRKEGNYGYIYQATNWEYLGYFVSNGFWLVDGEERHQITLWYRHSLYGDPKLTMPENLCNMYSDVRQTWTKQFIYIQRLDKKLTLATKPRPYPKPSNEYPIQIKEKIYKKNEEVFNSYKKNNNKNVDYYYEKEKYLFTKRTLIRRGEIIDSRLQKIAQYDINGILKNTYNDINSIITKELKKEGIVKSLKTNKKYKDYYFRYFINEPLEEIETPFICIINEIPFYTYQTAADYLKVSKQAVQQASKRKSKKINNQEIIWPSD